MALYHSAKGSVDYTIVGSPTIVDGVVSGFSGSSYLQSSTTFPGSTSTSLEFATKFNISSLASTSTIASSTSSTIPFHLAVRDSKFRLYPGIESTYKVGDFVLSANTDYWIKLFWDSTTGWKLQYSTNGINYTTDFENYNPSNSAPKDNYIVLGRNYPNGGQEGLLGTLDLNNTYIKVNGQPWFGICPIEVKKHQIMGPNGYTVEGSPSIIDGVMSNISNDNYAYTLTNSTMYQSIVDFETCIKFTTGTTAPTGSLFGWQNGHGGAYINNSHRIRCVAIDFSAKKYRDYLTSFSALQANKTYYFKYEFRNNHGYCSLKEEGGEWQTEEIATGVNNFNQPSNYNYFYGRSNQASGYLTGGASIDFNGTYIKVNGKLWFWQPQATKYIQRNNQLVWADPKLYLSGPVNYEVVGSPTIADGVASGFSNNDYITVPYFQPFSKNSFEYVIKFKIGISNSGTNGTIFSFPYKKDGSDGAAYGIYKYANALTAYCGYNANGDNITLSIPFTANSDIWVKWSFANGILKLTYSTDGINWNVGVNNEGGTEILDRTAQDISLGRISSWPGFSVDLNETYIKVNNQLWFYGKNHATQNIVPVPADYPLTVKGPVNYTIIGNPTITDGVASGFAGGSNLQGNYLKTQFLPDFTGDVEIGIKFKTDTWAYGVLMSWITSGISCYISINASGRPACFFSKTGANSTSLVINSTDHSFAFTTGQDCYLKVTKTTEGTLTMYHSNDGQAYTQFATKTNANYGTSRVSSYYRIGVNASYNPGQAFNGSIDLNETYINVNGQPWLGKAYPVPSIGYVDMRTQVFTAAPDGAVVGRDE